MIVHCSLLLLLSMVTCQDQENRTIIDQLNVTNFKDITKFSDRINSFKSNAAYRFENSKEMERNGAKLKNDDAQDFEHTSIFNQIRVGKYLSEIPKTVGADKGITESNPNNSLISKDLGSIDTDTRDHEYTFTFNKIPLKKLSKSNPNTSLISKDIGSISIDTRMSGPNQIPITGGNYPNPNDNPMWSFAASQSDAPEFPKLNISGRKYPPNVRKVVNKKMKVYGPYASSPSKQSRPRPSEHNGLAPQKPLPSSSNDNQYYYSVINVVYVDSAETEDDYDDYSYDFGDGYSYSENDPRYDDYADGDYDYSDYRYDYGNRISYSKNNPRYAGYSYDYGHRYSYLKNNPRYDGYSYNYGQGYSYSKKKLRHANPSPYYSSYTYPSLLSYFFPSLYNPYYYDYDDYSYDYGDDYSNSHPDSHTKNPNGRPGLNYPSYLYGSSDLSSLTDMNDYPSPINSYPRYNYPIYSYPSVSNNPNYPNPSNSYPSDFREPSYSNPRYSYPILKR